MADDAALRLIDIHRSFGGVRALRGVSLELRAGRVHALLGENGAGKSTLMHVMAGALQPDTGTMSLAGARYAPRSPREAVRAGVQLVHQELQLVDDMTVAENVLLGREPTMRRGWLDRAAMNRLAGDACRRIGLRCDPAARVATLGVAERQLVEIARAIVADVRVVALDEPSATLTDAESERLFATVRALCAGGVAVVYISHRLDEIERVCDDATILRDGEVVCTAPVAELSRDAIIRHMIGRDAPPATAIAPCGEGELLRVDGLTGEGFSGVSFAVRRGEVLGLAGQIGSGRAGVAAALGGAPPAAAGSIAIAGERVRIDSPRAALRAGLAVLAEDRKREGIVPLRSVRENVALASLRAFARAGWIDAQAEARATATVTAATGLRAASPEQAVQSLSGGNQQKAMLARLLLVEPRILVLNEPTRGVDVGAKAEIHELLLAAAARDRALLIVGSDLPELCATCHRIGVMVRGRLAAVLPRPVDPAAVLRVAAGG